MTCSATRRRHGRNTLKLILSELPSEESRGKGLTSPPEGSQKRDLRSSRTAAFFAPEGDEKMTLRSSLGLVIASSLWVWALVLAGVVAAL
jgi:hypothetical protein